MTICIERVIPNNEWIAAILEEEHKIDIGPGGDQVTQDEVACAEVGKLFKAVDDGDRDGFSKIIDKQPVLANNTDRLLRNVPNKRGGRTHKESLHDVISDRDKRDSFAWAVDQAITKSTRVQHGPANAAWDRVFGKNGK